MDIQSEVKLSKQSITYGYHHFTKHTVEKLYSNRHFLDWANQPDPFLKYKGALKKALSHNIVRSEKTLLQSVNKLLSGLSGSLEESEFDSMDIDTLISNLLFYSVAISAWKQIKGTDHKWALRVNASSGNLHPTETTVILGDLPSSSIDAGVYHYRADVHQLEARSDRNLLPQLWQALGFKSPPPPVMICLSSIFWRESWKYQDRAFRYCQLDLGHALCSVSLAASTFDYRPFVVSIFPDKEVANFLGYSNSFDKPFAFIALFPNGSDFTCERDENSISFPGDHLDFEGEAQKISSSKIRYDSIDEVFDATIYSESDCRKLLAASARNLEQRREPPGEIKPAGDKVALPSSFSGLKNNESSESGDTHSVIRRRRSAVDMDGKTAMDKDEFLSILSLSTNGYLADYQKPVSIIDGEFDTGEVSI